MMSSMQNDSKPLGKIPSDPAATLDSGSKGALDGPQDVADEASAETVDSKVRRKGGPSLYGLLSWAILFWSAMDIWRRILNLPSPDSNSEFGIHGLAAVAAHTAIDWNSHYYAKREFICPRSAGESVFQLGPGCYDVRSRGYFMTQGPNYAEKDWLVFRIAKLVSSNLDAFTLLRRDMIKSDNFCTVGIGEPREMGCSLVDPCSLFYDNLRVVGEQPSVPLPSRTVIKDLQVCNGNAQEYASRYLFPLILRTFEGLIAVGQVWTYDRHDKNPSPDLRRFWLQIWNALTVANVTWIGWKTWPLAQIIAKDKFLHDCVSQINMQCFTIGGSEPTPLSSRCDELQQQFTLSAVSDVEKVRIWSLWRGQFAAQVAQFAVEDWVAQPALISAAYRLVTVIIEPLWRWRYRHHEATS